MRKHNLEDWMRTLGLILIASTTVGLAVLIVETLRIEAIFYGAEASDASAAAGHLFLIVSIGVGILVHYFGELGDR